MFSIFSYTNQFLVFHFPSIFYFLGVADCLLSFKLTSVMYAALIIVGKYLLINIFASRKMQSHF